jgi:hypothetical protein
VARETVEVRLCGVQKLAPKITRVNATPIEIITG